MEKIQINTAYIPSDKIIARTIEDDLVLVPIESDTVNFDHSLYSLTPTGKEIWQRLSPETTVEQMCRTLASEYDESYETILKDTLELLNDLLDKGLIVQSG
ncbi:MAG: PqqD family protein [Desulfobacterales bacterium]|nr:PqqD family protein [Desulfobacterales bacterium]